MLADRYGYAETKTVIIAEGVETALSLKEAGAHATIVAAQGISNIKNYAGPESRIVIAGDNDTDKATERTSEMLRYLRQHFMKQGKTVLSIQPNKPGYNFNDVLKEQGISAVRGFLRGIEPHTEKDKSLSQ
ncbi:MAG: toprim domain-containing protein [Holosporaceae bacterium]